MLRQQYFHKGLYCVPSSITRGTACPFSGQESICRNVSGNIQIDTGFINSHFDLGINAPKTGSYSDVLQNVRLFSLTGILGRRIRLQLLLLTFYMDHLQGMKATQLTSTLMPHLWEIQIMASTTTFSLHNRQP